MNRTSSTATLLAALAVVAAAAGTVRAEKTAPLVAGTWDQAVALSEQTGAPILIDFMTDW